MTESITLITYILFIYLLFALVVERTMEILVAIYNYIEFSFHWQAFWDRKTERVRRKLEMLTNLNAKDGLPGDSSGGVFWKMIEAPITSSGPSGTPYISTELVRRRMIQIVSRGIALGMGCGLAIGFYRLSGDGTDLLSALGKLISGNVGSRLEDIPIALSILLSGAAIASGAEPLHKLVSCVEHYSKKNNATRQDKRDRQ